MSGYQEKHLGKMDGNVAQERENNDVNLHESGKSAGSILSNVNEVPQELQFSQLGIELEEDHEMQFENLPIEMLDAVFRRLCNPKDMLNCRQVCTQWKTEVDFILQTDPTQSVRTKIGSIEQLRKLVYQPSSPSDNPFPSKKLRYGRFSSEPMEESALDKLYQSFAYVSKRFGHQVLSLQYCVIMDNRKSARQLRHIPTNFGNLEELCIYLRGLSAAVQSHIIKAFGLPKPKNVNDVYFPPVVFEMKPGDTRSPMELGFAESLRARNSFFVEDNQPSTVPQLQKLKSLHIFSIDSPTIVDGFLERYGSQLEALEVDSSSICEGKYFATHQFPKLKSLKVFMASRDLISPKSLVSAENLPGLESLTVDFAVSFSKITLGQLVTFLDELPRTIKVLHVSVELEWVKISDEDQGKIGSLKMFPNLTVLTISATFLKNPTLLERLLSRIENLKVLKLELLTRGDIRKDLEQEDNAVCEVLRRIFRKHPSLVDVILVRNDFTWRLLINEYSCGEIRRYFVQDRSDIDKDCKVEFADLSMVG